MDTFGVKTTVYFGSGALDALAPLAGKRVFLVTDGFLAGSGLVERVREKLPGSELQVFDQVKPDPTLDLVARGVAALRAFGPYAIVAFGGGSPMDCAKAIRHFAGREGGEELPLYCVPTTAGTGSEVTSFAVLTDGEKGIKYPLVDDRLLPQRAILDPLFLEGVPPSVTADTGLDVLTHAAEAYVARRATPYTDALAEYAFALAWHNLKDAYGGNMKAKGRMLTASCMAGLAFNAAGLGICHSLAHALGGKYHLPHGRLNAMLLPHVILFNGGPDGPAGKKYADLARACGLTPTARALSAALARLAAGVNIPARPGIKIDRPAIAATALADRCTPDNPREVTAADLTGILKELG